MQKKIIYVDVDDTIAETRRAVLEFYRDMTKDYTTGLATSKEFSYQGMCPKMTREQIENIFIDLDFFRKLKPIDGAVEGLTYLLNKGYDVRFCTAHKPEGRLFKDVWLNTYFPMISKVNYVDVYESKKDYRGYAFIDDGVHHLEENQSNIKILFDNYDIFSSDDKSIIKINNWTQIREVL